MVKISYLYKTIILLATLLCASVYGQEVSVTARVQGTQLAANAPFQVIVTVSRSSKAVVDAKSFQYDNKPIAVEHVGDSSQRSISIINGRRTDNSTVISTYRFILPAQPPGLYLLEAVSVNVDGTEYFSKSTTYQMTAGEEGDGFRLEAGIQGPNPLYPGQRATLVYRIYFKDDVELTVENLPLFDIEGFRLIGDKQARGAVDRGYNIQDIVQEVEAETPGTYSVQQSVIEGYNYKKDIFGRHHYVEPRLRATAPPLQIVIAPFPEEGRPDTFKGGVGEYTIDAERIGSGSVRVGDKVVVKVSIKGGEPHAVMLPPIGRQEGFSGRFRMSDLPPIRNIIDGAAVFELELRPLRADIDAVPAISWSSFNPKMGEYQTIYSQEIPLQVLQAPLEDREPLPVDEERERYKEKDDTGVTSTTTEKGEEIFDQPYAIEIAGNYQLTEDNLTLSWWETPKALWLIVIGVLLVQGQQLFKKRPRKRRARSESRKLLNDAIDAIDPAVVLMGIEKALLLRLWEKGHISEQTDNPDILATKGIVGEVRVLLIRIEEERFAGGVPADEFVSEVLAHGREMFDRV